MYLYDKNNGMTQRDPQIPVKNEIKIRLKALKGQESYSTYLDRLMRSGSKND